MAIIRYRRMKKPLILLLLFIFPLNVTAYFPDSASLFPTQQLAVGNILVASEVIKGGIFRHSVILLTHHDRRGTIGLILNRPSIVQMKDVAPDLVRDNEAGRLYVGGPVEQAVLSVLIKSRQDMAGLRKVLPDIFNDYRISDRNADRYFSPDTETVRFYSGYAGWGGGQLEAEINGGGWYILNGDPDILFDASPDTLWQELLKRVKGSGGR